MAAKVVWALLWPVALGAGFFDFLIWGLTCGDDGPADYGSDSAYRYCRAVGDWDAELFVTGTPLLVLAVGVAWWDRARSLRWVNVVAYVLTGAIAVALSAWATAYGAALLVGLLWLLPFGLSAAAWDRSVSFAPESDVTAVGRLGRAALGVTVAALIIAITFVYFERL
jgi:hypothetical protein